MSFYQHRPDFVETRGRSRTVSPPASIHGSLRSLSPEYRASRVRFDVSPPPYRRSRSFDRQHATCPTRTRSRSRSQSPSQSHRWSLPDDQYNHNLHQALVPFNPRVSARHTQAMNPMGVDTLEDDESQDQVNEDDWDCPTVERREYRNNDWLMPRNGFDGDLITNVDYYGGHRSHHRNRNHGHSSNINVNVNNGNSLSRNPYSNWPWQHGYTPGPIIICAACGRNHGAPNVIFPGPFSPPIIITQPQRQRQKQKQKEPNIVILGDVMKIPSNSRVKIRHSRRQDNDGGCAIM